MLVKTRDAVDSTIETLVWRGRNASDAVTRAAYVSAAARLRADPTTEAASKFIDKILPTRKSGRLSMICDSGLALAHYN